MEKTLHAAVIQDALSKLGWSRADLANQVAVSPQVVSHWLTGKHFPRPDKLLKLALKLRLSFEQMVQSTIPKPVIAFRAKANAKTNEAHLRKAHTMGVLLRELVDFLPAKQYLRTELSLPDAFSYSDVQNAAAQVRMKLEAGSTTPIEFTQLVDEFKRNDAVIVPVLWGEQEKHRNALHILLPEHKRTFVYVNLDTYMADFKFWMAHELAHVYTPELAGTDIGEDFADAFAGELLYPSLQAKNLYDQLTEHVGDQTKIIEAMWGEAQAFGISIYTVYKQLGVIARDAGQPMFEVDQQSLGFYLNAQKGGLVSERFFGESSPTTTQLISVAQSVFHTDFFAALANFIKHNDTGVGYVQQILDIGLVDAKNLHHSLTAPGVSV
jgi:transcriptional regulator with XRE-family HTH domain